MDKIKIKNKIKKIFEIFKNFFFKHENIGALCVYIALICIFYSPVVFFNRSLISAVYHPYTVTENGAYGYEGRKPAGAFNVDVSGATYAELPVNRFVGEQYKSGQLPLWNPYEGPGQPLARQLSSNVFFPYQILEDVFPISVTDFFYLGRFLIAGFFTFLFLRALGLSKISSLIGGGFYMFSGTFVWFFNNEQMSNPAMMLPIVMWATEKLLTNICPKYILAFILSLLALLISGVPGVVIYILLLLFCYLIFRLFFNKELKQNTEITKKKKIFVVFLSITVALILVSPLIFPFLDHLNSSFSLRLDGGLATIKSLNLGFMFFPGLSDILKNYTFGVGNGKWDEVGSYLGIIPALLIIFGLFGIKNFKKSRLFLFFLVFGFTLIFKNYGWLFLNMLGKVPLLSESWSQRWGAPALIFSLICATSLGLESVRINRKEIISIIKRIRARLSQELLGIFLIIGSILIFWLFISLNGFDQISILKKLNLFEVLFYFFSSVTLIFLSTLFILSKNKYKWLALLTVLAAERWLYIPYGYQTPLLKLLPLLLLLSASVLIWKEYKKLAIISTLLFILSFNFIDYFSPFGLPSRFNPFNTPPYIEFLKSHNDGNYRVLGTGGTLMPNVSNAFAVQDFRHIFGTVAKDFYDFKQNVLNNTNDPPFWFMNNPPLNLTPTDLGSYKLFCKQEYNPQQSTIPLNDRLPFFSLLGIKYFLVPNTSALDKIYDVTNPQLFPLVYDKEIKIYENPFVLPRVFTVSKAEFVNSYFDAHEKMKTMNSQEMSKTIMVEGKPEEFNNLKNSSLNNVADTATIISYSANKIIIEAKTTQNSFLVLTDQYNDGWKASVNGKPVKIYRADGLFRSIYLNKGDNQIIFEYKDDDFRYGLLVALMAIPGLILLCYSSKKTNKIFLIIVLLALAFPAYQFYARFITYLDHSRSIHAYPTLTTKNDEGSDKENVLLNKRIHEMNFISKYFEKFFPKEVHAESPSSILALNFLQNSVTPVFVIYKDNENTRGILINIAEKDNLDFPYSEKINPIMDFLNNEYSKTFMGEGEEETATPPAIENYEQNAGMLKTMFFIWKKNEKILENKIYYVTALHDFKSRQWLTEQDKTSPMQDPFDTYQYNCKTAKWEQAK